MVLPIPVISYKPGYPETPAYPHQPGLQDDQQQGVKAKPVKKTIIRCRQTNEHPPGNKADHTNYYSQQITNITGAVIKSNFDLGGLPTYRAIFIHQHILFKIYRCPMLE